MITRGETALIVSPLNKQQADNPVQQLIVNCLPANLQVTQNLHDIVASVCVQWERAHSGF